MLIVSRNFFVAQSKGKFETAQVSGKLTWFCLVLTLFMEEEEQKGGGFQNEKSTCAEGREATEW